jgi:uncharacterized protein
VALILDTGPLYASLDRSDADHARCRHLIESSEEPLLIPAPVLVEMDYLIHRSLHPGVLIALLADVESVAYELVNLTADDHGRIAELSDRYADADIGYVDAAVLTVVERLNEPKLATLDQRHFSVPASATRRRPASPPGLTSDTADSQVRKGEPRTRAGTTRPGPCAEGHPLCLPS